MVAEARHEIVVISDSDVRVGPDYLRAMTAPLRDPKVGAVTCLYVPIEVKTPVDHLQSVGMMSDFYAGILVDWQLEGMKFALGPTIATLRPGSTAKLTLLSTGWPSSYARNRQMSRS